MQTLTWIDTGACARELGTSARQVRRLLAARRIVGAVKVSGVWVIPSPVQVIGAGDSIKGGRIVRRQAR